MLMSWALWNERNDRVFHKKSTLTSIAFEHIRADAILWVTAGARHLGSIRIGRGVRLARIFFPRAIFYWDENRVGTLGVEIGS